MTPRSQMACIPDDLTVEQMIAAAREHRHRRLPMYDERRTRSSAFSDTKALL
jgi:CBS domain containing-hemolysin-like protein